MGDGDGIGGCCLCPQCYFAGFAEVPRQFAHSQAIWWRRSSQMDMSRKIYRFLGHNQLLRHFTSATTVSDRRRPLDVHPAA